MAVKDHSIFLAEQFAAVHRRYGFAKEQPAAVSSRIDPSVYLIGSTISVLKPYLFAEAVEKRYLIQPAIRTRGLAAMERGKDTGSIYGSFFFAMGDIAPYCSLGELFDLTSDYLHAVLPEGMKFIFRVSSQDNDLLCHCRSHGSVEADTKQLSYYRHRYGLDEARIFGRNCNIAVGKDGDYRDIANIIVIEREGVPFAAELAIGMSTLLCHAYGMAHTMEGNLIADLLPLQDITDCWLADAISVVSCLAFEGVQENSSKMQSRLLRRYRRVMERLAAEKAVSLHTLTEQYSALYQDFLQQLP